ncbi:hypothetical protein D0812_24205 [Vibrio owensii]|uniref:HTH tetR-type domain-containing protein n=1 Tax=Vibrio owensii TaxID=696485 RepID=A0AAP9GGX8_9VIBR|nr:MULTISPECIES: hypothetical protein [Vibrio harveyi group]AYO17470.1 hypothetical protein D0812_24205 [Vibrio owensii]KGR36756.1 LuxT transcriptional regulator [Vibrio campbellii]QGH49612.1 hypothetical protein APZ19_21195 [Vibrio owensii]
MGRITKEQREKNFQQLNRVILDIFLNEGWSKVTYDRISKETGLRKSTLQGYYPTNSDFLLAVRDKLRRLMLDKLDFSSKKQLLISWNEALAQPEFSHVVDMFISHCVSQAPAPIARKAMKNFHSMIEVSFPQDNSVEIMSQLFGRAVINPILLN